MDMPPSRYKVVEKGRRLVVIDRLTGEQVERQRPQPAPGQSSRSPVSQPPRSGGEREFTTESWYDDKAPRTLAPSDEKLGAMVIAGFVVVGIVLFLLITFGFFVAAVIGFAFMNKAVRTGLRQGMTAWLDGIEKA
jgi:hypothetical protein